MRQNFGQVQFQIGHQWPIWNGGGSPENDRTAPGFQLSGSPTTAIGWFFCTVTDTRPASFIVAA
jgi:hypothetical protein